MITVRQEQEAVPSDYPAAPGWLSSDAMPVSPAALWQRLESWITRRYPVRAVTWIVDVVSDCGCSGADTDEFVPRLTPATLTTAESWDGSAWQAFTPTPGPLGLCLADGTYRLTYDVGEATPPEPVLEAYARLAEYLAEAPSDAGLTSLTDGDYSMTRRADTVGNALQYSGAADLLRGYR